MHPYRCKILPTSLRTTWKNLLGMTIEGPFVKWKVPHQTVKVPSIIQKAPYFLSIFISTFFFSIHVCAMKKISGFLYIDEGSIFSLFHYFRRPTLGPTSLVKGPSNGRRV